MNEDDILYPEQPVQDDNEFSEPIENSDSLEITEPVASDPESELGEGDGSAATGEVVQVIEFPEYTEENPLPVMLVEPESSEPEQVEVFALTGKYYGTISETYLDYFEGIVQKLKPNEHYVVWRSGQNAYTMAYGKEISLDGTYFTGDCRSVNLYRSSSNVSNDWFCTFSDDSLYLSADDLFVYSDLGEYPLLERGGTYGTDMALLVSVLVATTYMLARSIFDYIVKYIYRR